ncbi:MAG: hypothetical protein OK474_08030 [Thaumarchaeota archaeon]|nr:hypothetical protein [Nitrososphaerota archaeon]
MGQAAAVPVQGPQGGYVSPPATGERKNPWVAAILNLIFGIGYLYLGYKKVLGIPTIAFVFVILVVDIVIGFFTFGLISFIIAIVLAYDGYLKANGGKGYIGTEPVTLYR